MRLSREVFLSTIRSEPVRIVWGSDIRWNLMSDLMIPDPSLSIEEGAIAVLGWQSCATKGSFTRAILDALCKEYHFDLSTPFQDYPKEIHDILIHGTNGHEVKVYYKGQRGEGVYDVAFEGLIKNVERRYRETGSESSANRNTRLLCRSRRVVPAKVSV